LRGLILIAAGIKVFEDADLNKQRRAPIGQGIMRMLACYEDILKHKEREVYVSPDYST
jgi:hypothetical protein